MQWLIDFEAACRDPSIEKSRAMEQAERLQNIVLTGLDRDAIAAIKLLWAYYMGMPKQTVDINAPEEDAETAAAYHRLVESAKRAAGMAKDNGG